MCTYSVREVQEAVGNQASPDEVYPGYMQKVDLDIHHENIQAYFD